MNMTAKKSDENKTETKVSTEGKKKTLNGFDMSEYVAHPIESKISIERKIINVPAKKPNSQQYFRIHPTIEVTVDIVDYKDEGILYLVKQSALPYLMEQAKRVILYLGILRTGTPFLFPVQQPDSNGKWNPWHRSAAEAVLKAKENWVRMQAHGAEILRLAISMCFDDGIKVIAPVHDAILVEGSASEIDSIVKNTIKCMEDASEYIINYKIRAEAKITRYPDHYTDSRGKAMWETIWKLMDTITPQDRAQFLMNTKKKKVLRELGGEEP